MKQRVLVFSVDAMVYEDLQHLRGCRNTKKYFQNACGVRHIRSIYPTVTYPAHTTILTGCYPASHGVISNTHFTTGSTEYEWLWDASNVKVPDVITAAKDQGYTTGAVFWPVTGNHKAVDYLIDEYWCPHEGETLLGGFANMGSSPEMLKIIEKNQHLLPNGGKLGRVALMDHPQIDHFLISCACDIIREYSPEFMLVHNGNIDDARHKYGVFNEEVLHGLDLVDLWIGQLMRALEDSGHLHDTDVIIVSDHGQMDLSRVIKPNVFFADAGLIQVDENGNLRDWTAFCCSNAMSAMVYLKDPANVQDYAKTYAVLQKMAAEGIYGFTTVYTKDETKAMGLFAGLPYSPQNCRILLRAIYYAAGMPEEMKHYYVTNVDTEVTVFPETKRIAVINNSEQEQKTDLYIKGKLVEQLTLAPREMRWVEDAE